MQLLREVYLKLMYTSIVDLLSLYFLMLLCLWFYEVT